MSDQVDQGSDPCHVMCALSSYYTEIIMSVMASLITGVWIAYLTVSSGADQRKHQSSAWLVFARGIHRWPVNSPHKGPVTRKIFPFDDVIMQALNERRYSHFLGNTYHELKRRWLHTLFAVQAGVNLQLLWYFARVRWTYMYELCCLWLNVNQNLW